MSATKFSSYPCYTTTLFLAIILTFVNQVHYANAYAYCQYYKPDDPWAYIRPCPSVCCPLTQNTRVNTTCCEPVSFYTSVTTTYTVFGYSWWIILICVICSIAALCILCQSFQRYCGTKHGKHFNPAVDPEAPFTISKAVEAANPVGNDTITLDQPPSYSNQSPTSPPSYITIGAGMPRVSE